MKIDSGFEVTYKETVKECITLIDEENRYEKEQICLAIKIGQNVDELTSQVEDEEALFKRLARDIFNARGKVIAPSKVAEYRQLYLNFHSMDTVNTMDKSLMNDVTRGILTKMALKDGQSESKPIGDSSPVLTMLKKASRLLDKCQVDIEEKKPEDQEAAEIIKELKAVAVKINRLLNAVQNTEGKSQLDFLNKPDISLPVTLSL